MDLPFDGITNMTAFLLSINCAIYVLCLSCFRVCSLLPCGHLLGHYHQDSYTKMNPSATNVTPSAPSMTYTVSPGLFHYHQGSNTSMTRSAIHVTPSAISMAHSVLARTFTLSPGLIHQDESFSYPCDSFSYQHGSYSFHKDLYIITWTHRLPLLLQLPM